MYLTNNRSYAALCINCNSNFKNVANVNYDLKESNIGNFNSMGNAFKQDFYAYCPVCKCYTSMSYVENNIADAVSILSAIGYFICNSSEGTIRLDSKVNSILLPPFIDIDNKKENYRKSNRGI